MWRVCSCTVHLILLAWLGQGQLSALFQLSLQNKGRNAVSVHVCPSVCNVALAPKLLASCLQWRWSLSKMSPHADLQIGLFTMKPSLLNTVRGLFHVSLKWLLHLMKVDMEDFHLFGFRYSYFELNLKSVKQIWILCSRLWSIHCSVVF
jgi:hypothetical protein